jgi:dTDP-4-amino-4,6-dideoxygalactose transaminase
LETQPGDEFIVPSYTFVSSANAFVLRGARPVFADVDPNGNILPEEVMRLRSARTRVVVAVHYAGNSCDLNALTDAAGSVPIVEDAAQALGASFDGRPLGTFGACGAISFHETKNVGCGKVAPSRFATNGCWNERSTCATRGPTGDASSRAWSTSTWVDVGSSYVLSDLNAAYLAAQLDALGRIQARRSELFHRYLEALAGAVERAGGYVIRCPTGTRPTTICSPSCSDRHKSATDTSLT